MKPAQILPVVLIGLMAASGAVYAVSGDWRRAAYWWCAAGLNLAVTV